jgi:predicted homoserine dehydrogenase-like protein
MSMGVKLAALAGTGPVQIGVIGAGKVRPMFRAQTRRTPGLHVVGSITIASAPARRSRTSDGRGKPKRQILRGTRRTGGTFLLKGAETPIAAGGVDIIC